MVVKVGEHLFAAPVIRGKRLSVDIPDRSVGNISPQHARMIEVDEFLDGVVHILHPVAARVPRIPERVGRIVIEAHPQASLTNCFRQIAGQVALGSHLSGVPARVLARPHSELVAVLGGQHDILGA